MQIKGGSRLLLVYAGFGLGALALYHLPLGELGHAVVYETVAISAVLAVLAGVWRWQPADPLAWLLLAAGLFAFFLGEVTWDVYAIGLGQDPFPSLADFFYLSGYLVLAAAVLLLIRGRSRRRALARASLLDAAIVTVAAAVLSWTLLIAPYASDGSLSFAERALSAAYPLGDLLLLTLLAGLLFAPGRPSPAFWLLAGGIAANLVADTASGALDLAGSYGSDVWLSTGWLLAYILFGCAALHPSMNVLAKSEPTGNEGLTRLRLGTLAAASLTAPTVLALDASLGETTNIPPIVAAAALLPLLALARVTGVVHELRRVGAERERLIVSERIARSEAEAAQRLLLEQNDRLRELDRLKDEFVALVSHELRTPLTSINGYLELVLDDAEGLSDQQRQFLGVVDRNSRRLLRLVGDLLFVAQIDAGRLSLELGEVDLGALASESLEGARPAAEAKGVEISLDARPLPSIRGDRARIGQLLDNLVSNAVKFTPASGRVTVALRQNGSDGDALLAVSDTGLGIPQDEQRHLFERFFRSSTVQQRAIDGTGLGLAIAKAIVDAHGGTIECSSEEGRGTTFRVQLPLAGPQEDEPAREPRAGAVV
jgi:signal transduction histidine kinase